MGGCAGLLLTNASHHDIGDEAFNMDSGTGEEPGRHSSVCTRDKYNRITGWVSQEAKIRF